MGADIEASFERIACARASAGKQIADARGIRMAFEQQQGSVAVPLTIKQESAIVPRSERFSHEEACRVWRDALSDPDAASTVVIDLRNAREVTTAAFARLVLLRRRLRANGRDLRLTNLRGRAENLYEVNRLASVLPRR
jgi:ABC-type transporter Mla MlaB component